MGSTEQRKLAAIMFTDMVGYSALAQRNEALALELVRQGRQKIAQRLIAGLAGPRGKVPQGRKRVVCAASHVRSTLSPLRGLHPILWLIAILTNKVFLSRRAKNSTKACNTPRPSTISF